MSQRKRYSFSMNKYSDMNWKFIKEIPQKIRAYPSILDNSLEYTTNNNIKPAVPFQKKTFSSNDIQYPKLSRTSILHNNNDTIISEEPSNIMNYLDEDESRQGILDNLITEIETVLSKKKELKTSNPSKSNKVPNSLNYVNAIESKNIIPWEKNVDTRNENNINFSDGNNIKKESKKVKNDSNNIKDTIQENSHQGGTTYFNDNLSNERKRAISPNIIWRPTSRIKLASDIPEQLWPKFTNNYNNNESNIQNDKLDETQLPTITGNISRRDKNLKLNTRNSSNINALTNILDEKRKVKEKLDYSKPQKIKEPYQDINNNHPTKNKKKDSNSQLTENNIEHLHGKDENTERLEQLFIYKEYKTFIRNNNFRTPLSFHYSNTK